MDNSKREEILKACLAEFAEYGYEKANTNRICEQAGVSKGLIFHYFGSKQKLFILTVEKCVDDIMANLGNFSVEGLGFVEAVMAYGPRKAEFFAQNPLHYKVVSQAFYHTPDELKAQLGQKYMEMQAVGNEIVKGLLAMLDLRRGVSPERAMDMITAVMGGLEAKYAPILTQKDGYSQELVDQMSKECLEMMELVLYGIADKREQ